MDKLKAILKKYDNIICSPDTKTIIDGRKKLIKENKRLEDLPKIKINTGRALGKSLYYDRVLGEQVRRVEVGQTIAYVTLEKVIILEAKEIIYN